MLVNQSSSISKNNFSLLIIAIFIVAPMLIQACSLPSLPAVPGGLDTPGLGGSGSDSSSDSSSSGASGNDGGGGGSCGTDFHLATDNLYSFGYLNPGDPIYTYSSWESTGANTHRASYYSTTASSDDQWPLPDDVMLSYSDFTCETGNFWVTKMVFYDNEGADGAWFTSDDIVSSHNKLTRSGFTFTWYFYNSVGDDGVWFTSDDQLSSYTDLFDNSSYCTTRTISYTPDGEITSYADYTCNSEGNWSKQVNYDSEGPDGKWLTSDDVISSYVIYTYDTNNVEVRWAFYSSPGADGTWFTNDDVPGGGGDYLYK